MRRLGFFCIFLMFVLLTGCMPAIKGPMFSTMNLNTTPENPGTGRVFFYRATMLGFALQPKITLNGQVVGKSMAKGFFYLDLPPGNYEVETKTEVTRKVNFILDSGQTRFIRFNISMGFFVGHVYGELIDQADAMKEIANCSYTDPQIMLAEIKKNEEQSQTTKQE